MDCNGKLIPNLDLTDPFEASIAIALFAGYLVGISGRTPVECPYHYMSNEAGAWMDGLNQGEIVVWFDKVM